MFEQVGGRAEPREARLAAARAALTAVQARVGVEQESIASPTLPLAGSLSSVLSEGLRRGRTIAVTGSTSVMLALAAEASREGAWTAAIGMPSVGVVAAARRGIDLSRLALIPHPGTQAAQAVGTCIDGMDIVLLGQSLALSDADRRRLSSRARERGCVLVVAGPWPGAHATLTVERGVWRGLGAGDGRLRERELTIVAGGRARGADRRVRVLLDSDPGRSVSQASMRVDEEVA